MTKPLYTGRPLQDNEFLLKVDSTNTGFLTKLTQKGQLPKAFDEWREHYHSTNKLPVFIHTETPQQGWRLVSWRIGKSQEWAIMRHPEGWTVEIYLSNFLDIVKTHVIDKGVLQGYFSWDSHKLKGQ